MRRDINKLGTSETTIEKKWNREGNPTSASIKFRPHSRRDMPSRHMRIFTSKSELVYALRREIAWISWQREKKSRQQKQTYNAV